MISLRLRIPRSWASRTLSSFSIADPVSAPTTEWVPKIRSGVRTSIGSGAAPTTSSWPRVARPATSGDIDAPLEAVAMIAAAPPRRVSSRPGSVVVLSMYSSAPRSAARAAFPVPRAIAATR